MAAFSDQPSMILTFLYTDIQGSTRLWEQYPDSMETALARHDQILRGAVEKFGGVVFRRVGDGICAVFANASSALAAALDAQIALNTESWGETGTLRVRIAMHTGEVEMQDGDYSGASLNRIGRLLGLTHGGQTLISQATQLLVRDALPPGVSLLDLGEVRLRDLSHPENVFQLTHPDLPADFPPLESLDRQPTNLPIQPSALIGRGAELAEILDRLSSDKVQMLTLTGPGGIGKTRLGLQAAAELIDRFEHGVYFIDLASIRDPNAVLPSIARTIGIKETGYRPVMEELKEQLGDKKMLLLLDNLEQVTAVAPQLVELLQECLHLKMLVTSRESLRVRVEQVFPVPPLTVPMSNQKPPSIEKLTQYEAVRLFIERAQAVKPDFQVTNENAPAVAEICIRLDGLPLAIELAASRIKLFPPQALLERLGSSLKLLSGGARDLPARQQTLRNTIGWSYELLDIPERKLFELHSVFPDGSAIEAFETIAGMVERLDEFGLDIIDGLASLVDRSLIRQVNKANGDTRLVMLETIREYAIERIREDKPFNIAACRAHATYFAGFAQHCWEDLSGNDVQRALEEMAAEAENVRAAWDYWVAEEDLEQLGKIIDSLWLLYDARGWYHAMIDLTTDLLNVLSSAPPTPGRAQQEIVLQTSLASALLVTKGYLSTEVEQAYNRALQLIEEQGEIPQLFPVLRGLSHYYSYRGEYEKAIRLGEYTLGLADKLNDKDMRVIGHLALGTNYSFYKSLNLGLEHYEKGIADYVPNQQRSKRFRFGSDPGVASHISASINYWMLGFPDKALMRATETVELARQLNHPFSIAYATFHTGLLYLWSRQAERAEEHFRRVSELAEEYDLHIWVAVGSCLHGAALVRLGREKQGLEQIRWGMDIYQGLKTPPIFWSLLVFTQAEACLYAGEPQEGLEILSHVMETLDEDNEGALACEFFRLRGDLLLAVSEGNAAEAEGWYQQAMEVANKHEARMLALRTAIRLSRLWRKQGKLEQSQHLLNKALQAMTEGFGTADMMEAKAMIEDQQP